MPRVRLEGGSGFGVGAMASSVRLRWRLKMEIKEGGDGGGALQRLRLADSAIGTAVSQSNGGSKGAWRAEIRCEGEAQMADREEVEARPTILTVQRYCSSAARASFRHSKRRGPSRDAPGSHGSHGGMEAVADDDEMLHLHWEKEGLSLSHLLELSNAMIRDTRLTIALAQVGGSY